MAEKKADGKKAEEKKTEKAKKAEEVKETEKAKKATEEKEIKDAKKATEVKEAEKINDEPKDTKKILNIIAIALIVCIVVVALFVMFKKPNPKSVAKDILNLRKTDPIQIAMKYGVSEWDKKLHKLESKYTTFKIKEVGEITKDEYGTERVEITYKEKRLNFSKIQSEVMEKLEEKEIKKTDPKYNKQFYSLYKKLLREKRDQLQETEETITLKRNRGEKSWIIAF